MKKFLKIGGVKASVISLIWVVCKEVRKRDNRVGGVKFWQFLRDIIYEQSLSAYTYELGNR